MIFTIGLAFLVGVITLAMGLFNVGKEHRSGVTKASAILLAVGLTTLIPFLAPCIKATRATTTAANGTPYLIGTKDQKLYIHAKKRDAAQDSHRRR